MTRVGWLDCSAGVSGDMVLGALADLGALDDVPTLVNSLGSLGVTLTTSEVTRRSLRAVAVEVSATADQPPRKLAEVTEVINAAAVPDEVRDRAIETFVRLAEAEAQVHGTTAGEVHFHEVGAVDSIVDILAGCLGLHTLGLDRLVVSPIALGGGTARTAHGAVPVPTPAVLALLRDAPLTTAERAADVELATPTGVALAAEWADGWGPLPSMTVDRVGVGAGRRDPDDYPNVVRLVVGTAADEATKTDEWLVLAANIDDLDPRLWPGVVEQLLAVGAADAWLTPILMKKGRPAHTVSALAPASAVADVERVLFAETSTIGVRSAVVGKQALARESVPVEVDGQTVRVKVARIDGAVVNAAPEFEDVAAAARALGVPVKDMLARCTAAAAHLAAEH
jgi:uncharacterized protein (TIGR00299 family) protein